MRTRTHGIRLVTERRSGRSSGRSTICAQAAHHRSVNPDQSEVRSRGLRRRAAESVFRARRNRCGRGLQQWRGDFVSTVGFAELDGAWVGTRGFGDAGIHGLEAFEARM